VSYLALAKQIETRQEAYRHALSQYWWGQLPAADACYQVLTCLLDELGIAQATRIRNDELKRSQAARGPRVQEDYRP
jgi:hypothetical protein